MVKVIHEPETFLEVHSKQRLSDPQNSFALVRWLISSAANPLLEKDPNGEMPVDDERHMKL
jgi:hypothetical protein